MKTLRLGCALLALVSVAHSQSARLANLSTRAQTASGVAVLTSGFVIGPGPNQQVLIRAIGPTLSNYGLSGVLLDPKLDLLDANGALLASNDNWNAVDGATMSSVGAFSLPSGSKDSAIVTTLAPGAYTAQVTGVGGTSGLALVEVYEVGAGGSNLLNLSTRAEVGTGNSVLISGLVVGPGSGTRRLLIRAAGPALGAFKLTGTLADPAIALTTSAGAPIATNDNWGTPVGTGAADGPTLSAAFTQAGAFPFVAGSADSALLVDVGPGSYGIQVSGVGGTGGLALVEVYDLTPASAPTVTIVASKANSDQSGSNPGEFTVTRTGDTLDPLTVGYSISGSALNGFDFPALPGYVTIPAGSSSATIPLAPNPTVENDGTKTATLTLTSGAGYTVGSQGSATVSIAFVPGTLYVATIRPAGTAIGSTASGTATILISASGTVASVSVTFSNLSSAEVVAHLTITPADDYVLALPQGQVAGVQWNLAPTGNYTSADLLEALRNGNLSVRIDTANFPSGEARGAFIQAAGSQAFVPPPAPPTVGLTNVTATDAARFLTQATFGPKQSEIDALTGGSISAWLNAQLAMPFTSHHAALLADFQTYGGSPTNGNIYAANRMAAWWQTVLTAPDQLRQRVAFALSELFVVSDVSLGQPYTEGLANYYDILGKDAFGNFRTLLNDVTLSPIMGNYLSSLRNAKGDPVAGTSPDENYAREVMQLFTIGLNRLQPDGTLQLDANGLPIPTYNQTTVTEMAKVFTGWSYYTTNPTTATFRTGRADLLDPMVLFSAYHDDSVKNIVNNVVIPASQGGATDLKIALDTLFNHPNTGPFVCRQLIQRLVTSNPSPAYVYRVAQVFDNDGTGTRGNLAAVIRAILTDYEARSPTFVSDAGYGKLKEPLLRATALLRAFSATPANGRYAGTGNMFTNPNNQLDQAPLRSPTVFNFFHPGYVLPGALAAGGLVAPEFEITDATSSIDVPNYLRSLIFTSANSPEQLDFTAEEAMATPALLDHLNAVLCAGNMPPATRDRVTTALAKLPASTTALEKAQTAVLVVATSPAAAVQQ
ncbi:MAG TPA: DUF1800 family protein [Opitutaceae bacterium]|nr:DUF1800 family protein [Opitutaceae bacterium]